MYGQRIVDTESDLGLAMTGLVARDFVGEQDDVLSHGRGLLTRE